MTLDKMLGFSGGDMKQKVEMGKVTTLGRGTLESPARSWKFRERVWYFIQGVSVNLRCVTAGTVLSGAGGPDARHLDFCEASRGSWLQKAGLLS